MSAGLNKFISDFYGRVKDVSHAMGGSSDPRFREQGVILGKSAEVLKSRLENFAKQLDEFGEPIDEQAFIDANAALRETVNDVFTPLLCDRPAKVRWRRYPLSVTLPKQRNAKGSARRCA